MTNPTRLTTRLAAYGAVAMGGGAATADIHVYEGPPIDLDGVPVELALDGLSFEFNHTFTSFTNQFQSSFPTCCSYTTTSQGGTFCNFTGTNVNAQGTYALSMNISCGTELNNIGFLNLGDPVNGVGCADQSSICYSAFSYWQNCTSSTSNQTSNCGEEVNFYVGFTVQNGKSELNGWMRIEGSSNELAITRWAFEDDGGPIAVGEEPPPPTCDADINKDGKVDAADLGLLIAAWGDCP